MSRRSGLEGIKRNIMLPQVHMSIVRDHEILPESRTNGNETALFFFQEPMAIVVAVCDLCVCVCVCVGSI